MTFCIVDRTHIYDVLPPTGCGTHGLHNEQRTPSKSEDHTVVMLGHSKKLCVQDLVFLRNTKSPWERLKRVLQPRFRRLRGRCALFYNLLVIGRPSLYAMQLRCRTSKHALPADQPRTNNPKSSLWVCSKHGYVARVEREGAQNHGQECFTALDTG